MKERAAERGADLLRAHRVAALGTMRDGAPSVTMTPYALLDDPFTIVVLVSGLALHTREMRAQPQVGVLVMEPESGGLSVHTLARVSMQAEAHELSPGDPLHDAARGSYVARFPDMAGLFELGDFTLFAIAPTAVRIVTGFAQAASVTTGSLAAALRGSDRQAP